MEECVRRNEEEGKEINPVTCNFVKKCKPGEFRNELGRCTKRKSKTNTQNKTNSTSFEPFVYTKPLTEKKRVTYNNKTPGNLNLGRSGRVTKSEKLYANHPLNTRTTIGRETRNSLNLERSKRGKTAKNEKPEILAELEQELGELDEGNMRPLQVRKRAELNKKRLDALAELGTPLNLTKKRKTKPKKKTPEQPNTEL
jgi:hypothetical protein